MYKSNEIFKQIKSNIQVVAGIKFETNQTEYSAAGSSLGSQPTLDMCNSM